MKTSFKTALAALALAVVGATAGKLGNAKVSHEPASLPSATANMFAADAVPVTAGEAPASDDMIMPETVIVVSRAHKASSSVSFRPVTDCAFAARPVVQGPASGMVRGFCN